MNIDTPDKQAEYTNLKVDFAFQVSILMAADFCLRHNIAPSRIVQLWQNACEQGRQRALAILPPDVEPALNDEEWIAMVQHVAGELRGEIMDAKKLVAEEIWRLR